MTDRTPHSRQTLAQRRELLRLMTLGAVSATIPGLVSCTPDAPGRQTGEIRKLRPVLDGEWWLIGASPKLDDLLPAQSVAPPMPPDPEAFGVALVEHGIDPDFLREMQESMQRFGGNRNEPVDHHVKRRRFRPPT